MAAANTGMDDWHNGLYASHDYGRSWEGPMAGTKGPQWASIACSDSGLVCVAAARHGRLWLLHGGVWQENLSTHVMAWRSVATDSAGTVMWACAGARGAGGSAVGRRWMVGGGCTLAREARL